MLCRCVEHRPTWRADAIVDIVKRRYSSQLSCRPRLLFTLALCTSNPPKIPLREQGGALRAQETHPM